jgi:hypothetical protein
MTRKPFYFTLLVLNLILLNFDRALCSYPRGLRGKSPSSKMRNSFSKQMAQKVIDYFKLEKINNSTLNNNHNYGQKEDEAGSAQQCDTLDEIREYFFKVYSKTDSTDRFLNASDIDNLILHQVTYLPEDNHIVKLSKKYRCPRKTVIII